MKVVGWGNSWNDIDIIYYEINFLSIGNINHFLYNSILPNPYVSRIHDTKSNQSDKNIPRYKSTFTQRNYILYLTIKLHNILPTDIKQMEKFKEFKSRNKVWLIVVNEITLKTA